MPFHLLAQKSQMEYIDSLKQEYFKHQHGAQGYTKALLYFKALEDVDPDTRLARINEFEGLLKSDSDKRYQPLLTRLRGTCLSDREDYLQAVGYYEKAIEQGKQVADTSELANAYNDLGIALKSLGDYAHALENFFTSLKLREAIDEKQKIPGSLNNIGMILSYQGENDKALEYYFKSLELRKKTGEEVGVAQALNNIALVYEELQDFPNALKYYQQSYDICEKINEQFGIALTLSNMGGVYGQMGEYEKAKEYYNKAIPIQQALGKPFELAFSYKGLANVNFLAGNLNEAEKYAQLTLELAEAGGAKALIAEISGILYGIYKQRGDFKKSLFYLEKNKEYKDILTDEQTNRRITQMEMEYSYQKKLVEKDKAAAEVALEQERKYQRQTYQLNLVIAAFVFLFIISVIILLNRRKLKIAKQIADNANMAKSEFLTNMSHEIRTPLNAVIGFSDLLVRSELHESQRVFANTVHDSAKSLLDIINDVLDFSKIEAGKLELEWTRVDLLQLKNQIHNIISYSALQKQLQLQFLLEGDVPRFVQADSVRLRQIIVNLLGNAIKFTNKGSVSLKCEYLGTPEPGKVILRFSVIDTGIGIPSAKQKKIFEAFAQADSSTTREFGGTGLGLSICSKLLALMSSKLKVISEVGRGSNFYFDVTLNTYGVTLINPSEWSMIGANVSKQTELYIHGETESNVLGLKILIAEDNPVNMLLAKTLLLDIYPSAEIIGAESGAEAIDLFTSFRPNLVFMDVQMPQMNGYEVTQELRKRENEKKAIIIALTAGTVEGERERCLQAGMNDYISKPIMRQSFIQVVEGWVNEHLNP